MAINLKGLRSGVKELLQYAESEGFSVIVGNGGHFKCSKSGTKPVFISRTPSDERALKNARADIRRAAERCKVADIQA